MKTLIGLSFLFAVGSANALVMSPGFEAGALPEHSYTVYIPSDMVQTEPDREQSQSCDFFLKDSNKVCDVKFIMFKQTDPGPISKDQIVFWSQLVSMNIAEDDSGIKGMKAFPDAAVAKEFNGDSGVNVFIDNATAPFLEGHRYGMANFFYKKDLGIMCEVLLFDDINIARQPGFMTLFHLFKFN